MSGRPVALVTGGSRGIGAASVLALAARGYDVVLTYRNKAARAAEVATQARRHGGRLLPVACDITRREDIERLLAPLHAWSAGLDLLILNASGGLERDLVAADPGYPLRINRDAQLAVLETLLPMMRAGGTVVFVTSHWAHRYGEVEQLPEYALVAETKHAGEVALRARQTLLAERGLRLLVVTGDLVEGTITPKLLERAAPGLAGWRRDEIGQLPTAAEMGQAIAAAATDLTLPSGHTIVVGGALESLPRRHLHADE